MVSVYEMVRDRIISSLEAGTVPWRQTWQSISPVNIATGKPYRGINRLLLSGHSHWGTYNKIREMGGHVRKGEKASGFVVFWSLEDTESLTNDNGDRVTVRVVRDRPLVRYYKVFNLSQCDDIAIPEAGNAQPITSCEEILRWNNPRIVPGKPACLLRRDLIAMPAMARFTSTEAYYAALFHELTTGPGMRPGCRSRSRTRSAPSPRDASAGRS